MTDQLGASLKSTKFAILLFRFSDESVNIFSENLSKVLDENKFEQPMFNSDE
jgi:hypothetical protein